MILVASVGNSHVTFGVHGRNGWLRRFRIQTVQARTADEYGVIFAGLLSSAGIGTRSIDAALVASVVPPLTETIQETIQGLTGKAPMLLSKDLDTGIRITTENPAEVGTDLLANAVAASRMFSGNCIVVDFGTALSFTAVAGGGELRGVAIAPGLASAAASLSGDTAQLPRIPLAAPPCAIGRNTVHSMQAGLVLGYAGLAESLIARIRAELGGTAGVVLTGGHSRIMAPLLRGPHAHEPWLTLEGLRLVAERSGASHTEN